MEKQKRQNNNIIIIILILVSLISILVIGYYKYKNIKENNGRIEKQKEERKAAEEKARQDLLKIHNIDKTPLEKDKLKERALEYLKNLNVKSNIISEKETTEKDINSKN